MASSRHHIPHSFLDFMDSVNQKGHDYIVLRANDHADDDTCLELDVRLHSTEPDYRYIVGLLNERSCFFHTDTGEGLFKAPRFIETLGFPENTPTIDDYYLGPFSEDMVLHIMAAAEHTAVRLDADKRAGFLQKALESAQKVSDGYGELSSERGGIVSSLRDIEKAQKRQERKGLFTVIEGGKSRTPHMG